MIINKKIKETFDKISEESIKYSNTPDKKRKYLKRLLKIFNTNLTEDEQIFIFKFLLEQIHYKNIITDPDNVVQIHNIKLKTITYIFFLTIVLAVIIAILFKVNDDLNNLIVMLTNVFKILSL